MHPEGEYHPDLEQQIPLQRHEAAPEVIYSALLPQVGKLEKVSALLQMGDVRKALISTGFAAFMDVEQQAKGADRSLQSDIQGVHNAYRTAFRLYGVLEGGHKEMEPPLSSERDKRNSAELLSIHLDHLCQEIRKLAEDQDAMRALAG